MSDVLTRVEPAVLRLTYAQISMAAHVAIMRRTSNLIKGRQSRHGGPNGEGSWEIHIMGCCGELAGSLYTNLSWCGALNDFNARDVGGLLDVRARTKQHYKLILHPDDPDDVPFVSVWPNLPDVELTGWLFAREGKRPEYWDDPVGQRPAFYAPQEIFRPMSQLLAWVQDHRRSE